uniref:Protein ALP1-like n=1 Tax=Tanacetum cinerariifolium TaxID=118510 RepID=A0A699H0K6_TANCI|nr:protein ALP1-like [Tanacetum cinerariifolium]
MNQNQIGRTVFDIDEETDAFYLQKAIEYHEWLLQQEAQPRLTRTPIFPDHEDAERHLRAYYFDDHYNYTDNPLSQQFHFFTFRLDCAGRMSISALMKCRAAIRQFAYGSTADIFDECLQMSEHTARDDLFFFNMCIIELYMPKCLRKPTSEDVVNIQQKHNNVHGFLRMLESIDSGANNDINVLDNSPLFDDLLDDLAPVVSYVRQENARKDVERAFGVLQGRWGVIQQPDHAYEVNTLRRIMYAGIIMYNMILEDQNMSIVDLNHVYSNPAKSMQTMWIDRCETQRRKAKELRDRDTHISLQLNHIWREVEEASEED